MTNIFFNTTIAAKRKRSTRTTDLFRFTASREKTGVPVESCFVGWSTVGFVLISGARK